MRTAVLCGCLLSLLLLNSGITSESTCSRHPATIFKLAITSFRNKTGHWTAQLQLEHKGNEDGEVTREVDFDQTVTPHCDGTETVFIVATITTPEGIAVLKPERRRTVPPGYKRLSNSNYFKEYPEATKWIEARDICEREGAHLAIINSEAEGKFVSSLWTNKLFLWAFIGTHDLYEEGNFVTIHNQTLQEAGYNRWSPGEPNGGSTENCGVIFQNGLLGNYFCSLPLPFFCEFEPEVVSRSFSFRDEA
ncbi:hemolymph lipopolysaccharide-binding protein-like isoform X2 [Zootermopsis nevadensis]|uniref:hemolymph lipopolysaccharide-binding protein-like isoform X2 n=1 Tax=Zootermopsis nevadensis TaxID=136037 RepID=UPI000B8EC53A|nr:hemolymph lipopolysaccharide-binding protein-like isoform X2 [Zootermopsis nevadensis]